MNVKDEDLRESLLCALASAFREARQTSERLFKENMKIGCEEDKTDMDFLT